MLLYSDKMDIQQEVEEKKKTWSIYRMKFYSVRKQNEIVNRKKKRFILEIIMLRQISQTQKNKYHIFSHLKCVIFIF